MRQGSRTTRYQWAMAAVWRGEFCSDCPILLLDLILVADIFVSMKKALVTPTGEGKGV